MLPSPVSTAGASDSESGANAAAKAVLLQLLIWTLGPALVFGNLHSDTLEAAYWGRDLALGYAKHPPLATWLMDAVLRLGAPPIASLMFLSQATVAVAAYFVWKAARLYASRQTASLAVTLFLVAPAATFYAAQMNHNSLLSPFWAAALYFGLSYLEERRWGDAIGLAIAGGLGMLTKYEMAFLLISLAALTVLVPRFRPALIAPASYLCILLFAVVLAPHVWWLEANDWPSASRALGADKMRTIATLNLSAVNTIVGLFTLYIAPVLVLFGSIGARDADENARAPNLRLIGLVIALGPMIVLIVSGLATMQVIKPLWVLPLASSVAVGLALLFPAGAGGRGLSELASARIAMAFTAVLFAGFCVYLLVAGYLGKTLAAYSADAKSLSAEIERQWSVRQSGPVRCIVISERKVGASAVLFVKGRPDFVDFSSQNWATPRQIGECRRTGAIAALLEPSDALDHFPSACRATKTVFDLRPLPGFGNTGWPVELVYIPPEGEAGGCDARR